MAKRDNTAEGGENTGAEGAVEAPKTDKRRIILKANPELGLAEDTPRADFIRAQWATGQYTRREITDQVSKLQGEDVAYQIVFQATKGVEGGPAPKAEAPAGAEGGEAVEA